MTRPGVLACGHDDHVDDLDDVDALDHGQAPAGQVDYAAVHEAHRPDVDCSDQAARCAPAASASVG